MRRALALAALCSCALGLASGATTPVSAGESGYEVAAVRLLTANGGRVDWSPTGEWIAYDRRGQDGFFDVYRIRPDGTGDECLTCDRPELPNRNQGQPAWHPSGRYIVFQAEMTTHPPVSTWYCEPGAGIFNDLWVLDLDTGALTQIRWVGGMTGGSLHPHFSHDGTKLLWSNREGNAVHHGNWGMLVADFVETPAPHLANLIAYNPGEQPNWIETSDWSAGDSSVYYTCNPLPGQSDFASDICRFKLSTQSLERLTPSSGMNGEPAQWDEFGHPSPFGDAILWMSSDPYGVQLDNTDFMSWLRTEYWLSDMDGTQRRRLTYFNDSSNPMYMPGNAVATDMSWSPDGAKIAAFIWVRDRSPHEAVYIIDLVHNGTSPVGGMASFPAERGGATAGLIGALMAGLLSAALVLTRRPSQRSG